MVRLKSPPTKRILRSNGLNLSRFIKTRINDENEGLKILIFTVPRPPPTRRGRLKQSLRRLRRRLWGSAGKFFFTTLFLTFWAPEV